MIPNDKHHRTVLRDIAHRAMLERGFEGRDGIGDSLHRPAEPQIKESTMKSKVGLWIDHRKAVIVTLTDAGEETTQIISDIEKRVRFSSGASEDGSAEDVRDRQYGNHLNSFYDEVIARLREAEAIQIFGPGEAKGQLVARLEHEGLKQRIVEIDTADKLTDGQIAAKVREHFQK